MSTKIYTAYRTKNPDADLFAIANRIKQKAIRNIRDVLKSGYKKWTDDDGLLVSSQRLKELYKNQACKSERNFWDFDVYITVHKLGDYYYFIPRCDMAMRKVLSFMKRDTELINYCYWNNTDKMSSVSHKAWDYRGKIWDILDKDWDNMLLIEICNVDNFYKIDNVNQHRSRHEFTSFIKRIK